MKKIDDNLLKIILFILSLWFLNNILDHAPTQGFAKLHIILSIISIILLVSIHDIIKIRVWKKISYKISSKTLESRITLNPFKHIISLT